MAGHADGSREAVTDGRVDDDVGELPERDAGLRRDIGALLVVDRAGELRVDSADYLADLAGHLVRIEHELPLPLQVSVTSVRIENELHLSRARAVNVTRAKKGGFVTC